MTAEAAAVAASVGVPADPSADAELRRIQGNFTQLPSMLQDVRAGRAIERQAILGAVIEIAQITGVAVPTLKNIAACVEVLDQRIQADRIGIAPMCSAQEQTA